MTSKLLLHVAVGLAFQLSLYVIAYLHIKLNNEIMNASFSVREVKSFIQTQSALSKKALH